MALFGTVYHTHGRPGYSCPITANRWALTPICIFKNMNNLPATAHFLESQNIRVWLGKLKKIYFSSIIPQTLCIIRLDNKFAKFVTLYQWYQKVTVQGSLGYEVCVLNAYFLQLYPFCLHPFSSLVFYASFEPRHFPVCKIENKWMEMKTWYSNLEIDMSKILLLM